MSFDAGSIDADLTLDRSAFTRALREARAQGDEAERTGIDIPLDIEVEKAFAKVEAMERELERATLELEANINVHDADALGEVEAFQRAAEAALGDIPLQIDIDTARAEAELLAWHAFNSGIMDAWKVDAARAAAEVDVALGSVPDRHVQLSIDWDLNQAAALGQLELFNAEAEAVTGDVHVNVDVDTAAAMGKLALLRAQIALIRDKTFHIDAEEGGGLTHATGTVTRMEALIAGLLILAPLIPAALAPAIAAVGGLAASLVAVAGGLGVLGLGVGGFVLQMIKSQAEIKKAETKLATLKKGTKEYADQQKIVIALQDKFNQQFGQAAKAFDGLKGAWTGFQDATRGASLGLITQFLQIITDLLPRLVPIFDAFAAVASHAFDQIKAFMDGPESDRMLKFFETIGAQSFDAILRVFGNLALLFGRLFEALGPEGVLILNALADAIGGLADDVDGLGQADSFQKFIAYANEQGPKVLDLLGSFVGAITNLIKALAPLAGPALTGLTAIFDAIANAPTGLLTTLIVLFGGWFIAVQAFTAIGQIFTATTAAMTVAMTIFNAIMTVIRGVIFAVRVAMLLLNAAFLANPIGVIIIAIVALVALFILLYNKVGWFHDGVDAAVHGIVGFFQWLWDQTKVIFGAIGDFFVSLWSGIVGTFKDFIDRFQRNFAVLGHIFKVAFDAYLAYVKFIFNAIVAVFTFFFVTVPEKVRAGVGVIARLFREGWHNVIEGARIVFGNLIDFIKTVPGNVLKGLGNLGSLLKNAGKALIQGLIDGIQAMFKPLGNMLSSVGGFITDHFPGSPAKRGPLSQHGGYHMVHAGAELIRQLNTGINSQPVEAPSVANQSRSLAAGISGRLARRDRLAATRQGGDVTVNVINSSRMATDESLDIGLKRVAISNGWA